MKITDANIGNVICLDQNSRFILIEDVNDEFIQYRQESGHSFATYDREIAGTVVRDPNRISEFHRNAELGAALLSAETSAMSKILNGAEDPAQREEAASVLRNLKGMQKNFSERLSHTGITQGEQERRASLDQMISRANQIARGTGEGEQKKTPVKENPFQR